MESTVLTVKETAAFLRISPSKAYQLVRSGTLPSIAIGRRRVVPRQQLLNLIESTIKNGGCL